MRLLLSYLKNYKLLIFTALLLAVINQCFSLLDPYIFGKIIDTFASKPKSYTENEYVYGVFMLVSAAVGVAMISRTAKAFQDYVTNLVIQQFGAAVYTDGLKHSLLLPYQEFEDQRSGQTLNVLQKVRTDTERFIQLFINILFSAMVGMFVVLVFTLNVYGKLVIVYFIASFIISYSTQFLSKRIKGVQKRITAETNQLAGTTTESLRNIELIKSLGLTMQEVKRLNEATQKILGLELEKVRSIRSIMFIQGTMINLLRQTILFLLLYLVFGEHLKLGQLMTLQFYSFFIFNPLQEMGSLIIAYREAQASLKNFAAILANPIEKSPESPKQVGTIQQLAFSQVAFQHKTAPHKALNNISFEVKKGETIAFVGPSGAGKSTLVKLLVGLYDAHEGAVCYNGIASKDVDKEELRHQIGFVTQDTQLFAGTIKENMLFVKPDATDEQIVDVLRKAACHTLLERSENGINTVIGEGGMKVSGGEKQRLSIARAILRQPNLFVFDEATSALDSMTEDEISTTIRRISAEGNHITVMIAHRLSTILHADRIYVLEKGEIVETGTHDALLLEKGLYYAMWRQQIGERK